MIRVGGVEPSVNEVTNVFKRYWLLVIGSAYQMLSISFGETEVVQEYEASEDLARKATAAMTGMTGRLDGT